MSQRWSVEPMTWIRGQSEPEFVSCICTAANCAAVQMQEIVKTHLAQGFAR